MVKLSARRGSVVNRCAGKRGQPMRGKRGQPMRGSVVSRCGEAWSTGARGSVVSRCGEAWSTGAGKRGQQVRGSVVNRCGEAWSTGAGKRGQQVRGSVVNRCGEAWSAGAGKRGQPVRDVWSTGAGSVVSWCVERGQQVQENTDTTNVLKGFSILPDLPDLPDLPERGEGRRPVAACVPLTRHAATGSPLSLSSYRGDKMGARGRRGTPPPPEPPAVQDRAAVFRHPRRRDRVVESDEVAQFPASITSVVDAPRLVSSDASPTRPEWAVTRSTPAALAAACRVGR